MAGSFGISLWDKAGIKGCWWSTVVLAVLPREWQGNCPAVPSHPKNLQSGFPSPDTGWSLCASVCESWLFVGTFSGIFVSQRFHFTQAGAAQPPAAVGMRE